MIGIPSFSSLASTVSLTSSVGGVSHSLILSLCLSVCLSLLFSLRVVRCVTGCVAAALDTPADTIKTRLQNGQGHYKGVRDCFTRLVREEGVMVLFRGGCLSPLSAITQTHTYTHRHADTLTHKHKPTHTVSGKLAAKSTQTRLTLMHCVLH